MAARNSDTNFGWVTKTFHWLTALLIITTIPIALLAHEFSYSSGVKFTLAGPLYSIHKTLGVTLFFVALARIIWAFSQPKPKPIAGQKPFEHWLAALAHWCLYISLVMVPLTGWIHHAATAGFAPINWPFGQGLPFVPKSESVATIFSYLHVYLEKILLFALIAHILGALKHHFVDKDATLKRMITSPQVEVETLKPNRWPLLAAIGIYVLVALLALAQSARHIAFDAAFPAPVLWQNNASEWQVKDGTVAITIDQFDSKITGEFADWTADISFDPDVTLGHAGTVDVKIAIASLTLGSVTAEAMGRDYFDANSFPVAEYNAKIVALMDTEQMPELPRRYTSEGVLTLKGQSQQVNFNFSLDDVEGDMNMIGKLALQRLDFGVGDILQTGDTLGLSVEVDINLTAQRQ